MMASQKTRTCSDKAEDQKGRGQCMPGVSNSQAKWHRAVEDEIKRDIEIGPKVAGPTSPRHRSVEAVTQPVSKDQQRGSQRRPEGCGHGSRNPEAKAEPADRICRHAHPRKSAADRVKAPVDPWP